MTRAMIIIFIIMSFAVFFYLARNYAMRVGTWIIRKINFFRRKE